MTPQEHLIQEIEEKYGEWLEHAGDGAPNLMVHLLASLLLKEKEKVCYYRRVTSHLL